MRFGKRRFWGVKRSDPRLSFLCKEKVYLFHVAVMGAWVLLSALLVMELISLIVNIGDAVNYAE